MRVFRGFSRPVPGPTALAIGNFDGVHRGHAALLNRLVDAAHGAGLPATILTFEPHPREFFAPASAPARLTTLREKLELLSEAGVAQVMVCRFNADFAALSAHVC
jgi:riboflavin kinase/FMN adenylyltransferase